MSVDWSLWRRVRAAQDRANCAISALLISPWASSA
jgi:hypothetical protein